MTDYTPPRELVEAASDAWWAVGPIAYEARWRAFCCAAVAFRHPDGHPELVPWEQVRELVDAARALADNEWMGPGGMIVDLDARLRAALAPFTQEPET